MNNYACFMFSNKKITVKIFQTCQTLMNDQSARRVNWLMDPMPI